MFKVKIRHAVLPKDILDSCPVGIIVDGLEAQALTSDSGGELICQESHVSSQWLRYHHGRSTALL